MKTSKSANRNGVSPVPNGFFSGALLRNCLRVYSSNNSCLCDEMSNGLVGEGRLEHTLGRGARREI